MPQVLRQIQHGNFLTNAVGIEISEEYAALSRARIEESARRELNLMPAVIDAVKASATLGEISDTLRRVYKTYDPNA